jgi:hypothetical protein
MADDLFLPNGTNKWMKHINDSAKPVDYKKF